MVKRPTLRMCRLLLHENLFQELLQTLFNRKIHFGTLLGETTTNHQLQCFLIYVSCDPVEVSVTQR